MSAPLNYLTSAGDRAGTILPLTWFLLGVSISVVIVIAILSWLAVRRRPIGRGIEGSAVAVERSRGGVRMIAIGLAVTSVPLIASLVWTVAALSHVALPPRRPQMVVDVSAHQWWWEAEYESATPSDIFATANEIHVPLGQKVLFRLTSDNVIHSFWVPQLTGKTDVIPGQTNLTWLQADVPGRYRGQCGEYCGLQHAHMAFEIVAEPLADFERWRRAQLQTAPPPATPLAARGLALFEYRCSLCHTVRGTTAGSNVGPDLTHLQSRRAIAALTLPNNRPTLAGWIENPQSLKPGTKMPNQHLSADDLNAVTAYLETLK